MRPTVRTVAAGTSTTVRTVTAGTSTTVTIWAGGCRPQEGGSAGAPYSFGETEGIPTLEALFDEVMRQVAGVEPRPASPPPPYTCRPHSYCFFAGAPSSITRE